ncbi:hypothetical protein F5X68DRAFT_201925 [Plectosphaerella plurivora]|uniref:Uncharacterized protein n=1 Tax=Plectosphaerella plurivora TaxID=936078 RepID=A0A9P8VHL6_9PEZI|nr:hypothetical protein F5X68DRAFT_201925 [Plectosphaerella plurivora]
MGKRRRDRIQATRKVVKAFLTVTGVNLARSVLSIEQENNTLRVSAWAQSLSRRGLPPDTLIYKGHPPLDNAAAVAARDANTDIKELRAVLRKGLGEEPSKDRIACAEDDRRHDLWRYQATHQLIATVRSGRQEPHLRGWLYDNVTLSAVATPHDATSLWTALSYCVSGHFEHAMKIKASIYSFFYEVMNKGSGRGCGRHSRYRMYHHLQRSSLRRTSAEEKKDWGSMSLFRSLAVNDPGAGPPGFTRFEEIFWVIADFFGTEVVVFTPKHRARGGLDPVDGYTLYNTSVYGLSPGLAGWPTTPSPLEGTAHHSRGPRFFNAEHQILLVTDRECEYVMPVRKAPMLQGPGAGGDPSIDTAHYDDGDRWFKWGPRGRQLIRPPNIWLMHSSVAPQVGPMQPIDPGGFLPWIPASVLDVPQAATARHENALQSQPQDGWMAPKELWDTFEARIDAPQMARLPEDDATINAWTTWMDSRYTNVPPLQTARYMYRDGPRPRRRFKHQAQAQLFESIREAYMGGWAVPYDPLNGMFSVQLTDEDGETWLRDDDDVAG